MSIDREDLPGEDNEGEHALPKFHNTTDEKAGDESPRTPDSSTAESKSQSFNFTVRTSKPSDAELQSLKRDSYLLVNTGNKAWELYYIGSKAGKNSLDQPEVSTLLPMLMKVLPASANLLEGDEAKKAEIHKLIKDEKAESDLVKSCEEFFKNEREFHNIITRFLRDCALVYGKLDAEKQNELDIYLDRYRALKTNQFPDTVDVTEVKSTFDKAEKYISVIIDVMEKSRAFKNGFMMMEEIQASYPEFQKDWLTLSDKMAEPLVSARATTGYPDVLVAKQGFSNDSAAGYQHKIKIINVLTAIMQNLQKRYPESDLNGKLEKQAMELKSLARKANDDQNFMFRTGILGRVSDAISIAGEKCKKLDSESRRLFKAFNAQVIAKMKEVQAENVSPDHVASFFYADFVKTYISAYAHAGQDKTFLKILQKFIIDLDTYLAERALIQVIGAQGKKLEDIDKLIFDTLNKEVEKRIQNSEYEYQKLADKTKTVAEIQGKHAKDFMDARVRYLFDEAKSSLGEKIESKESDESVSELSNAEAKKAIFINARKAIVQMGPAALAKWNEHARKEFLELQISPAAAADVMKREQEDAFKKLSTLDKTEQKRTAALVKLVSETFHDSLAEMKGLSADDLKGFSKLVDRFKRIDVEAQDKAQVRKNLLDIIVDINAYAYQIGRRKEWTVRGKDSVAQASLVEVQNFIRNIDKKLVSQGQDPLMVDRLDQQKSDPVDNAVLIFNRLPRILGKDFDAYVKKLYSNVKREIKKVEPIINEWLKRVDDLAKEKAQAEKIADKKEKKQKLADIEKRSDALEKELKNLSKLEGGEIYKIRMEIVNTLKMIERMGIDPAESNRAKEIWNKAFAEDPEHSTLLAYEKVLKIEEGKAIEKGKTEIHESYIKGVFDNIIAEETAAYREQFKQDRGYGFTFIGRSSVSSPSPGAGARRFSQMGASATISEDSSDEEKDKDSEKDKKSTISSPTSGSKK